MTERSEISVWWKVALNGRPQSSHDFKIAEACGRWVEKFCGREFDSRQLHHFSLRGKDVKIKIERSPYGDSGAEYDGLLGMMQHFRLQLMSFRGQQKTKEDRERLEADIAGYDEIIKSASEENARAFLEHKRSGPPNFEEKFKDSLTVIGHIKTQGLWK